MVIADLVREPVDSMVTRVKKEGYRAIEGMPYSGVSLDNPRLPREFRELGAVIDGLLYGLSARQAELKRVTAATQEAEEALAVTVNESADATILVQDGLIRIANPATTSHFGVAPRNLLGRTPKEVFGSLDLAWEDGDPRAMGRPRRSPRSPSRSWCGSRSRAAASAGSRYASSTRPRPSRIGCSSPRATSPTRGAWSSCAASSSR